MNHIIMQYPDEAQQKFSEYSQCIANSIFVRHAHTTEVNP